MWCKTDGEKEDRGPNRDVGIEGNVVQMAKVNGVRPYGHVLRRDDGHEKRWSLKGRARGSEDDQRKHGRLEDASGEGEQECWLEKDVLN